MKQIGILILLIIVTRVCLATHNRAGEITYRQINALSFEIKVVTFTNTKPTSTGLIPADRPELEVRWGDNTYSVVPRSELINLPDYYRKNTYVALHTYPGPGTYEIVVEDPNRNEGVQNIPNSVNVVFSIRTIMQINPVLGTNNTPELLNPPVDKAAIGQIFIHNPSAYDRDGDSLSYKLTVCSGENGQPIQGFTMPPASHRPIYINELTGDLVWDAPMSEGIFNVAILIEEWRQGIKIGEIVRDMQIEVFNSNNTPPLIDSLFNYCVEAGDTLRFRVSATDPNNNLITLSATGGAFLVDYPAVFPTKSATGTVTQNFIWRTRCAHVRKQPYLVVFKAQDNNNELNLVDLKNVNIKVIGPAPQIIDLIPSNNSVEVVWNSTVCENVAGYAIYRSMHKTGFIHDSCQVGVPDNIGYQLIKRVFSKDTTHFLDNNSERGLVQGYEYCYLITAFYIDGAESFASEEWCTQLKQGIPVITQVDVLHTGRTSGEIKIAWAKPVQISEAPPPYKYLIYHSNDLWGTQMQILDTIYDFNDTTFTDTGINTFDFPFSYKVEFHNNDGLIDQPMIASSVFIKSSGADNRVELDFLENVPWRNSDYIVYRKEKNASDFDSIGTSNSRNFIDRGLRNGDSLIYQVVSKGRYDLEYFVHPIINHSQEVIGNPLDTISPLPPNLQVESYCDSAYNHLVWHIAPGEETTGFKVYYSPTLGGQMSLILFIHSPDTMWFNHYPASSMAGCYAVASLDSAGNQSPLSQLACVDECKHYLLPNVFTPDGDGSNDLYIPVTPAQVIEKFVDKIDIKIYGRWGNLVFETNNKYIRWDGKDKFTGILVSDGVYFYVCDVYEHRLSGSEPRYLTGFIYVFSNPSK